MAFPINDRKQESIWKRLEKGAKAIYSKNISKAHYTRLYTLSYKFCTNVSYGCGPSQEALYKKLEFFLRRHVETIYNRCTELIDEPLLIFYVNTWEKYLFSSKVFNGVFSYLNRPLVYQQRKKRGLDLKKVYHLTVVAWSQYLKKPLQTELSSAMLKLIERERHGERINTSLIKSVLNSFLDEIENHQDPENLNVSFYKEAFETKFLKETELYYTTKSASILLDSSVSEFMKNIDTWFTEEFRRCELYLYRLTSEALTPVIENVTINKHKETFYAEFKTLLMHDKTEDLKRMYRLLSRVSKGKYQLAIHFEEYVAAEGLLAVEKYNSSRVDNSEIYITALVDVRKKYASIIVDLFESDKDFSVALDKACEKFMNKNAITESSGLSSKSAELLAKYFDLSLKRKRSSNRKETNDLNEALVIFKYIKEKEEFRTFYMKFLALRLLQETNVTGNDEEFALITTLQEACGFEYTNQMMCMFRDVSVSRELTELFRNEGKSRDVDFSIITMKSSVWPFHQSTTFSIPQELEESVQQFTNFYNSRFNGRKLTWLYGLSKGELVSRCFLKKYTFHASTFQMAVLLQFNSQIQLSFEQLKENTQIRSDILLQVLQALAKLKLLKDANRNPITESSSIKLNLAYRNKKLKVNINTPIKSELKLEQLALQRQTEMEKKFLIQAAIVRIAKIRRVIKHTELLTDVLKQLSSRFNPEIRTLKECIDILIEKNYLKRVENDSYSYVA